MTTENPQTPEPLCAAVGVPPPASGSPVKRLVIRNGEGKISIAEMRRYFEKLIADTPWFAGTPLGIMEVNGEFHHYMDPDTDTMWMGFALGMRLSERLANEIDQPRDL